MSHRFSLLIIGILGISGVGLGAFGAHLLRDLLIHTGMQATWATAVNYQLLHTVALLALALHLTTQPAPASRCLNWVLRLWMTGILLFSGSLYGLALGGPKLLGPVTPLGGLALLAGWACLMLEAFKAGQDPKA